MTTATAPTWPKAAALNRVSGLIAEVCNAVDEVHLAYWRIANQPDADALDDPTRLPTFEELGRLSAFIAALEADLDGMGTHLTVIRQAHDAAAARMQDAARYEGQDDAS